jgi:hypothetical protein
MPAVGSTAVAVGCRINCVVTNNMKVNQACLCWRSLTCIFSVAAFFTSGAEALTCPVDASSTAKKVFETKHLVIEIPKAARVQRIASPDSIAHRVTWRNGRSLFFEYGLKSAVERKINNDTMYCSFTQNGGAEVSVYKLKRSGKIYLEGFMLSSKNPDFLLYFRAQSNTIDQAVLAIEPLSRIRYVNLNEIRYPR